MGSLNSSIHDCGDSSSPSIQTRGSMYPISTSLWSGHSLCMSHPRRWDLIGCSETIMDGTSSCQWGWPCVSCTARLSGRGCLLANTPKSSSMHNLVTIHRGSLGRGCPWWTMMVTFSLPVRWKHPSLALVVVVEVEVVIMTPLHHP